MPLPLPVVTRRTVNPTADLIRLMDFLEMYHVDLLICSNGINTASGLYKIFIQIFAVIAEFERDTLTERIVDNMMELAKDGRWLGGNTPMGFTVRRVTTGSGSEWIIAVGRHEGFISSEQWIEVQELLDAIAEKYNRPHRKTNALLAGLVHCPYCGRRLSVISESDRWTNGKPRFKYVCPGYRKKECNFKAVDGVLLDEFVVQQLSELSDENSERFRRILEIKIEEVLEQSQTVQEHNIIKKKRDKLKADIAAQTRNLREADGSIKQFIQEDLQNLAEELRETERQLSKLDEGRKNNMIAIRDLEMTKERLLSFAEYAKDAQPEVLVTLIQTIVERIYIVDKDDERFCHIFIKGCAGEDYTGFFQTAGYIEHNSAPVCDSEQYCICTKISETSNIWTDSDRYREHPKKTVRV